MTQELQDPSKVRSILKSFGQLMDRWDAWLMEAHQHYLSGQFESLERCLANGQQVVHDLQRTYSERREWLSSMREQGMVFRDLRDGLRFFGGSDQEDREIERMTHRLQGLRQHSLSLWVLAFQCLEHTSQVLQLLSTGEAHEATYDDSHEESLGGGRLINQAA